MKERVDANESMLETEERKTIKALVARIRELEDENAQLRNALIYNWLHRDEGEGIDE